MNDKTAKLIRRYAGRTDGDAKAIKRKWNAMSQEERRRFRKRMESTMASGDE